MSSLTVEYPERESNEQGKCDPVPGQKKWSCNVVLCELNAKHNISFSDLCEYIYILLYNTKRTYGCLVGTIQLSVYYLRKNMS